jgi:hypothetical protein
VIEAALQYAGRGWAIVPMRANKHFYTRDGVRIATRDPKIVGRWWWAETFGLACGTPSGVDVLDIDDREAFPFDLATLLASTLAAATPSGGCHLFFRHAGLRNQSFAWGEWRSTGLAVVLPPAPGRSWINQMMPAEAPPKLLELLNRPTPADSSTTYSSWPLLGNDGELPKPLYLAVRRGMPSASLRDQRRVMGALRKLVHATHHRNNALNRAAFCFRAFIAEGLTTAEQARAWLEMASAMNGYTMKDGIAEVRSTIASGLGGQ